jgi:nicotinamide riboside kinase
VSAFVVALLGAESTGKTTLAQAIGAAMAARGMAVAVVDEALRDFCARTGRTPRVDEQAGIAAQQTALIDAAARQAEIVVADTSALMVAVYSELIFADSGLYEAALAAQARYDLTLVTALDLPWLADGIMRDGAHVRAPVDALVRSALARRAIAFATIAGQGDERLARAMRAIDDALARRA